MDQQVSRVERWERRAEVPLLLLGVAFLVSYAWPVLDPRLDANTSTFLTNASWAIWAAFGIDFLIRLRLADARITYARQHWYDVGPILLPLLRPLRLLRLVALLRILDRSAATTLTGRVFTYVVGAAIAAAGPGAIAVLDAEQDAPGANITSFGDALWWAASTVTTVGYGDVYPVTTEGRVVATCLMVVGIALVGAVTAAVASWMIERVREEREEAAAEAAEEA